MVIRDAADGDLQAIVEIYNEEIPTRMATADLEPVAVADRAAWFARRTPQRHPVWVAEADGEVAGWLGFEPFYGRPAYRFTAEISVYVARAKRRRGVGASLLEHALRRGPELGLSTLLGFIFAHNQASVALFEGFGFERWGHLPRVALLDGRERDLLILGRRLPA
jgi:L-amino acid N-acyltransferase YncA